MKILFVCTGNTCRSPMAEFILKDIVQKQGLKDIFVSSAGLCVDQGDTISDIAKQVLQKNNIAVDDFCSTPLTSKILNESDLVLCMTKNHKKALPPLNKIKTLGEVVGKDDVSDPFACDEEVYTSCFLQLKEYIQLFVDKLQLTKGNV